MSTPLDPIPAGYGTVTPCIISTNAAGLNASLERSFDGELVGRVDNPDGSVGHAEVRIGTSIVMMFDGKSWEPTLPSYASTCRTRMRPSKRLLQPAQQK